MPRLLGDDAALLLTGDRGRAEDLVQTALFETFRRWSRLRERADPVGYARKALITIHLNWVRRRSWHESVVAAPPGAVLVRMYDGSGAQVAQATLDDGVVVQPDTLTVGQRPASSVEAFTADGTSLGRAALLG